MLNEDYKEMLQLLNENKVIYLVVGAYAMAVLGYVRATGDIDFFVEPSAENSRRLYAALKSFGAPLNEINENTFCDTDIIYQIGVAPRRVDIMTGIDGVQFGQAYSARNEVLLDSIPVPFLSKEFLIQNKKATGREKDAVDLKILEDMK